jgi:hypothetical protein
MIDVTKIFTTHVGTPEEFLKIIYGSIYLLNKDYPSNPKWPHEKKDFNLHLQYPNVLSFKDCNICHQITFNYCRSSTTFLFESCITQLACAFHPQYPTAWLRQNFYHSDNFLDKDSVFGARITRINRDDITMRFRPEDVYFQFPTARDRVSISAYLSNTLRELALKRSLFKSFEELLCLSLL